MKRTSFLFALLVFVTASLRATSLAPDLSYIRAGTDIAAASKLLETGSAVIDLRYAGDEAAASLLAALRSAPVNPPRILLVLVSPETSPAVRTRLTGLSRCLTVGRVTPDLKTDIVVSTPADADRRAFDAIVGGTPPEKLIAENADKPRFDETALVYEHVNGVAAEPPVKEPTETDKTEKPPFDAVLQRAVHIHRGLVALKKT